MRHLQNIGCAAARLRHEVDIKLNEDAMREAATATDKLQVGINNETFNSGKEVIFSALTVGCEVCELTVSRTTEGAVISPAACPSGYCEALLPEATAHDLKTTEGVLQCTPFEGIRCGAKVDVSKEGKAVIQEGGIICHVIQKKENWQQTKIAEINGTPLESPDVIATFDGELLGPETGTSGIA